MVRVEGKFSTLEHVFKMPDRLETSQKFTVIRRPISLMRRELGGIKSNWLPSFGATLREDASDG